MATKLVDKLAETIRANEGLSGNKCSDWEISLMGEIMLTTKLPCSVWPSNKSSRKSETSAGFLPIKCFFC